MDSQRMQQTIQPVIVEDIEYIQYVGLHELDDSEKEKLDKLTAEYHQKVKRLLHNDTSLTVHIKKMRKNGKENKQHKYSITVKTMAPTKTFRASSNDWNLNTAVHDAFLKLEKEVEKVYKRNDLHKNHIKFTMKRKRK